MNPLLSQITDRITDETSRHRVQHADTLAGVVERHLCGLASKEELRRALRSYHAVIPFGLAKR